MRKQGRLNLEEARQDVDNLNLAADKFNLPKVNELANLDEVKALEEILASEGVYRYPEYEDVVILGQKKLEAAMQLSVEKPVEEVHWLTEGVEALRKKFIDDFALQAPPFNVERIIYLERENMDNLFPSIFSTKNRGGCYDSLHQIAVVCYEQKDPISKRIHVGIHETTHHYLFMNTMADNQISSAIRESLNEGVTEQIALEAGEKILLSSGLINSSKEWLAQVFRKNPTEIEDNLAVPSLKRNIEKTKSVEPFDPYVYNLNRFLIDDLFRVFLKVCKANPKLYAELQLLKQEPLKIFANYLTGRDKATMHKLLRIVLGEKGFNEVHNKFHSVKQVSDMLNKNK